ncbi:MAG TPA: class F sortase [Pseudonocardia sp.]|nr:class F sortase [Pseudonocardia sp.]
MPGTGAPPRRGERAGLLVGLGLLVVPTALWLVGTTTGRATAGALDGPTATTGAGTPVDVPPVARIDLPAARGVADVSPVRVRLVRLGVDAPVLPVGVDGPGEMAVPADVRTVGWYRFGPRPGDQAGSSVLAGHVDDRVQGHGAFYQLIDIAAGDEVQVQMADGVELRYRVESVERVEKGRLPAAELFARDGPPRLTLITCGGEFDRAAGRYRDNVVVQATPLTSANGPRLWGP